MVSNLHWTNLFNCSGWNYDFCDIATPGKSHRSWRFQIPPYLADLTRAPG